MWPRTGWAGFRASVFLVLLGSAQSVSGQAPATRAVAVRAEPELVSRASELKLALEIAFANEAIPTYAAEPAPAPPELSAQLAEAHAAYDHLRPAEALRTVDGLLARFEASGGVGLSKPEYVEALVLRALGAMALGLDSEADQALSTVAAVDPAFAPSASVHPPALSRRWEALRAGAPPAALVRLTVAARPRDAAVWVDGERVEGSGDPLTVRVAPGRHLVRVAGPFREPFVRVVEVSPDGANVEARLEPSASAIFAAPLPPDFGYLELREAARRAGATLVAVELAREGDGFDVVARDQATRRTVRVHARRTDRPARTAERVVRLLVAPVAERTAPAVRRRTIALATSAAAAAVLGVTLGVVFARRDSSDGFVGQWSRDVP